MNHHNLFNNIKRTDNLFMLTNGLLLLCVTFLPFPTSLVAEYFGRAGEITATAIYCGTFVAMACAFNILWRYASYKHRLINKNMSAEEIESINRQYLAGPSFYGLSLILSFVNVSASLLLTTLLALFYGITASISRQRN